jgi:DNA-binding CsgD family transcriptional regulator
MVTLIPLYCEGQEIVALQTFSNETRIFHFQDYLAYNNKSVNKVDEMNINENEFSERELEVLFLLSHGLTQEQCAQIQGISRSTVATMIKNLCAKFGVAGSNSKVLQQIAFQSGHHKIIPSSLWKPCVIITESEAVNYVNKKLVKK